MKALFNKKILFSLMGLVLCFALIIIVYLARIQWNLPDVTQLKDFAPPVTSKIYAAGGEVLLEIGKERREMIDLKEVPQIMIDAFLASEDSNFYNHSGVDLMGIARAMLANIKAGRIVQGGSTITQQVAKSLLLTSEKSISRKIKDFLLAIKIEKNFSKEEILYLYLNQVYLGGGYYGVKAAGKGYFDKELKDVTAAEAALLAGLLVAPGRYSPYINPKRAKARQTYVLSRLFHHKKITKEEYEAAKLEAIKLSNKRRITEMKAPYFTEWIRQRVVSLVGEDRFLTEGFEIKTTLDLKLQEEAERAAKVGVRDLDKRQGYKGALETIEKNDVAAKIIELRSNLLDSVSSFTYMTPEAELINEVNFEAIQTKENSENIVNSQLELDQKVSKSLGVKFFVGNKKENLEKLTPLLKSSDDYKALVLGVSSKRNLALIDVGGIRGIISYDNFNWARKRVLSDKLTFRKEITHARQILKPGDVIYVGLVGKKMIAAKSIFKLPKGTTGEDAFYLNFRLEQKPEVQTAIVSVDAKTGDVLTLVGGSDFWTSQFNRAIQSKRQPGSAFKPFIYASALEEGFTASSILLDTPQALNGVDSEVDWKPRNYDGKFKGFITLRESLEESRNVPTITLLRKLGLQNLKKFLTRMGLNLSRDIDLSIALGSFGFTLLDMTRLYSLFPNGGKRISPRSIVSIVDRNGSDLTGEEQVELAKKNNKKNKQVVVDGKLNFEASLGGEQIFDSKLAYIMTKLMQGVVKSGTGTRASYVHPNIGGKTGTTNGYVDAWFIGFTENMVTGVWTGFDNNSSLGNGESGAKAALPIWADYMDKAVRIRKASSFKRPSGIIALKVDKKTGKVAKASQTEGVIEEYFVKGTEPGGEFSEEKRFDEMGILDDEDYYSTQNQ